ncbi:MAG: OmpA family protein [Bacteroidota bacterium]
MSKRFLFSLFACFALYSIAAQDLPPNPEPGKCYVRCTTPDVYETVQKTVLAKPVYNRLAVKPAQYRTVEETILVKPASKRYVYVPAKYRTITREIRVEDPYNAINIIPAQFASSTERIETRPKSAGWEYQAAGTDCYTGDCEVLCYVERPAEYRTVPVQTLANGPSTTTTQRGGRTITVEVEEIVEAARVEEVEIPAEYRTITKKVLVSDETVEEIQVPAEYATVTTENLASKGGLKVWEEIDCKLTDYNVLPILYEFGSARLTSASRRIIDDKLYALMRDKSNISVEITSHTDARGSASGNLSLSERRAQSVVNYLVNKGISRSRLVAKGFGETRLKNRCRDGVDCAESEHAINRRTEFRVINK